ncbi:hypothetical protein HDU76_011631, partial [Blyttiomyces sp. JEL0837]
MSTPQSFFSNGTATVDVMDTTLRPESPSSTTSSSASSSNTSTLASSSSGVSEKKFPTVACKINFPPSFGVMDRMQRNPYELDPLTFFTEFNILETPKLLGNLIQHSLSQHEYFKNSTINTTPAVKTEGPKKPNTHPKPNLRRSTRFSTSRRHQKQQQQQQSDKASTLRS